MTDHVCQSVLDGNVCTCTFEERGIAAGELMQARLECATDDLYTAARNFARDHGHRERARLKAAALAYADALDANASQVQR